MRLRVNATPSAATQVSGDTLAVSGHATSRLCDICGDAWTPDLPYGKRLRCLSEITMLSRSNGERNKIGALEGELVTYYRELHCEADPAYRSKTGDLRMPITEIDPMAGLPTAIQMASVLTVFYRLFEAHFLPVHLVFVLAASSCYTTVYPGFLMPLLLKTTLDFCSAYRLVTFGIMLWFFHRYEQYHSLCVGLREEEMRRAGLLEVMIETDSVSPNVFVRGGLFEAALFPIGGFIFGAIPALQAVVSHVFTERLRYTVSLKPQLHSRHQQLETNGGINTNAATKTLSASSGPESFATFAGDV